MRAREREREREREKRGGGATYAIMKAVGNLTEEEAACINGNAPKEGKEGGGRAR